ncbi:MAG: cation:proton antiporter [Burkholderiales bacterium]|nr:cation:proton antiporter [Burkholderiales bacterium]
MLSDLSVLAGDLVWPIAFALAWVAGELGHRWTALPRISLYGAVGFALGSTQLGWLPRAESGSLMQLANVAFGLILFEFGYRINLRWLVINRWLTATGLMEAAATFIAVYYVATLFDAPMLTALLLASLSMSTSPAAIMRVVNEQRSTGQVTERVLHLAAINCVLAVFAFKVIVGFWTFHASGSIWSAVSNSLVELAASVLLGTAMGVALPALLRTFGRLTRDVTLGFAIGVIVLVALAQVLRCSPLLGALAFGIVARYRRVVLNPTQRNFGVLGDLLGIVLFVFVAATLEWQRVQAGIGLALALIGCRFVVKVVIVTALAQVSGTSWRKGVLTGMALTPISVFVILLLEHSRFLGIDLLDQLAPLAAATLMLDLVGPVIAQRALIMVGESIDTKVKTDAA